MKNYKSFHFAFAAAAAMGLSLTACGDDVTEVIIDHEGGVTVLEAGEKLSKQVCDTTNKGEMLFVMDSSEAFFCDGKSWQTLKGEKGETGDAGKDGSDGANGTSCTVKPVKNKADLNGLEVTCGKTVVDTIWNGAAGKDGKPGNPGKDGTDGANGTSCTAKSVENDAGLKGFELTCGETVVGTIWDGQKGSDGGTGKDGVGCSLTDDDKGSVSVTCGDDDPVTIYKAVCDTKPYDPEKQFCDTRDNQIYRYVLITEDDYAETWMAENLNYSVNPGTQSWCGGGNDDTEGDCSVYGRLYTWAAAVGKSEDECGYEKTCNLPSGDIRGICPEGWHLPSNDEWNALITAVGGTDVAGKKLKANVDLWNFKDGISNDDSYGFSALPAGKYSGADVGFLSSGIFINIWSSEEYNDGLAYYLGMAYSSAMVSMSSNGTKKYGFSVRCLQNN